MKLRDIEGIVVGETNYSESSKILNVFTKEEGIISILSKGCRKPKSKFREISNKMSLSVFSICYKENGISTCCNGDIINNFKNILTDYKDIEKISYALYIIELTREIIREKSVSKEENKDIYDLLINALKKIDEGFNPKIISNILELKYLDYLGVKPVIDECSVCGSKKNIVTASVDSYGYVCKCCYQNEKIMTNEAIKMLRMLYSVDISRITKLEIDSNVIKEVNDFIDEYYEKHTGLYLQTKKNLKNLTKITLK